MQKSIDDGTYANEGAKTQMWPAIVGAMGQASGNTLHSKVWDWQMNRWAAADANWENQKAMDKQNEWTKMMSDTAHQREIQDMIKAGLNPILSSGGKGASSPSSASPGPMQGQPALHYPGSMQLDSFQRQQQLDQQQSQLELNRAETVANIAKKDADKDVQKLKKELMGNSLFEEAGKQGGKFLRNMIEWATPKNVKKTFQNNQKVKEQIYLDSTP